jgi:short-subunit dehydrogenase
MDVRDKVVIVTGASSGIGLATAWLFAERGARLALVARSRDRLEMLARELQGSVAIPADMTKTDEIAEMVAETKKHFGRSDVLVNNAGQGYDASIEQIDVETFHHIFELDVVGPLVAMQRVIPGLRRAGGGAIVNVSSGLALMAVPGMSPYSAAKRALVGLSLTAREDLKEDGIVVSVVYPYATLTDFEANTIKAIEEEEPEADGGGRFPPDTADYVAQKILEAIETGEAEAFAHDWMKNLGPR